jgi:hypothetical protein
MNQDYYLMYCGPPARSRSGGFAQSCPQTIFLQQAFRPDMPIILKTWKYIFMPPRQKIFFAKE